MEKQALGRVSRNDSQNRPGALFSWPQLQRKNLELPQRSSRQRLPRAVTPQGRKLPSVATTASYTTELVMGHKHANTRPSCFPRGSSTLTARDFPGGLVVKNLSAVKGMEVRSLVGELQ